MRNGKVFLFFAPILLAFTVVAEGINFGAMIDEKDYINLSITDLQKYLAKAQWEGEPLSDVDRMYVLEKWSENWKANNNEAALLPGQKIVDDSGLPNHYFRGYFMSDSAGGICESEIRQLRTYKAFIIGEQRTYLKVDGRSTTDDAYPRSPSSCQNDFTAEPKALSLCLNALAVNATQYKSNISFGQVCRQFALRGAFSTDVTVIRDTINTQSSPCYNLLKRLIEGEARNCTGTLTSLGYLNCLRSNKGALRADRQCNDQVSRHDSYVTRSRTACKGEGCSDGGSAIGTE